MLFVSLISGFVFYRSGALDHVIQLSPNGGNVAVKTDSLKSDTIEQRVIMPSSKVHILVNPLPKTDTAKIKTKPNSSPQKRKETMSSSKSMMILDSEIFDDSTQNKKDKE